MTNRIATSNDGKAKFRFTLDVCFSEGMSAHANRSVHVPRNRYTGRKAQAWERGWAAGVDLEERITDAKLAQGIA
jgi:hypothetical protein